MLLRKTETQVSQPRSGFPACTDTIRLSGSWRQCALQAFLEAFFSNLVAGSWLFMAVHRRQIEAGKHSLDFILTKHAALPQGSPARFTSERLRGSDVLQHRQWFFHKKQVFQGNHPRQRAGHAKTWGALDTAPRCGLPARSFSSQLFYEMTSFSRHQARI